jgi:hypothetical protein
VREIVRADPVSNAWSCKRCVEKLAESPPKKLVFEEDADGSSAKMSTEVKESLRVIQWNAAAVSTKMFELEAEGDRRGF